MNRNEFIEKLVAIYEDFNEINIQARQEAYIRALDTTLDFDTIYDYILKEYESFKYAPTPAYILKVIIPKIKDDKRIKANIEFIKQLEEKSSKSINNGDENV